MAAEDDEQKTRILQLRHQLENWREVIVPAYSVLRWKRTYDPAIIVSVTTLVFLLFWLIEPSVVTTVALLGAAISCVDYLVPIITASICNSNSWTGKQQQQYETACADLFQIVQIGDTLLKTALNVKQSRPSVFFVGSMAALLAVALFGSYCNNLLLLYLIITILLLLPGVKAHGLLSKAGKKK